MSKSKEEIEKMQKKEEKKNQDNIDIIKSNLRKEYIDKLKRNRKEYSRKIYKRLIVYHEL